MTIVWHPQRQTLPYYVLLNGMVRLAIAIVPAYPVLAGWALWLRISQYGWSPERLYGVLITLVALVWAVGFCISVVFCRRRAQKLQASVIPLTGLLALILLILIHTPVLDPWRISVETIWRATTTDASTRIRSACICSATAGVRDAKPCRRCNTIGGLWLSQSASVSCTAFSAETGTEQGR